LLRFFLRIFLWIKFKFGICFLASFDV